MKNRLFSIGLTSIIISLALTRVCLAEQDQLGQITFLSGDAQVKGAKETVWRKAELNMPVFFGDNIRTREDGKVTITFVDGSLLKIHSNTHIALNTIVSPVEKKSSVLLFFGRMWNKVSRKVLKMKAVEIQTPTAVLGVRGTEFETGAYEDGTMIVRVDSGGVTVDNEIDRSTLSSNEGTQLSLVTRKIKTEPDFRPEWERIEKTSRESLFADGERYGGHVNKEIYRRRDHLKGLVDKAKKLSEERERFLSLAEEAKERGDEIGYESSMAKTKKINKEIGDLNKRIAFYGRRLECHFGLFSHYGYLAKHPEYSKQFRGKEFILKQLDNIEMIYAEFNAMIEEGMKMSMEDMEDLMDEMKEKVRKFRRKREKKDPFDEMDEDF
ncbi:MAG: FecR domain-containing protein [Deltaproteobacteria bacterium]|nr:MAG: FecR domain-containing protein [Deltaproteobacteria bacterium]